MDKVQFSATLLEISQLLEIAGWEAIDNHKNQAIKHLNQAIQDLIKAKNQYQQGERQ